MHKLKYILLYTPVVLISIMGFVYYGVKWDSWVYLGLRATSDEYTVNVFKEWYRLANTGIAPLCFVGLICLQNCLPEIRTIAFRAQCLSMLWIFIIPKVIDHVMSVRKVYHPELHSFDAYTYNFSLMILLVIGYIWCTQGLIKYFKKRER